MAILQVRDVDDRLYLYLKEIAKKENRSLSQEVISILEEYLSDPHFYSGNPTQDFLRLSSSWEDNRSAEDIVTEIKKSRRNRTRLGENSGLFD